MSSLEAFHEREFRNKVDRAMVSVKQVLHNTRRPQYAADVPHTYDDKYGLAQFLTNLTLGAQLNCLEVLGVDAAKLNTMREWASSRTVTLRLTTEERCSFVREQTRQEESKTQHVTENRLLGKSTHKVVTTINEFFWHFECDYKVFAFRGNNPHSAEDKLELTGRLCSCEIMTTTKSSPRVETKVYPPSDVEISWLLQSVGDGLELNFKIDRGAADCHTPRRNAAIARAMSEMAALRAWCDSSRDRFFASSRISPTNALNMITGATQHGAGDVFVPVVPLFEAASEAAPAGAAPEPEGGGSVSVLVSVGGDSKGSAVACATTSCVLPVGDCNIFLAQQKRSLAERFARLAKEMPAPGDNKALFSTAEGMLVVTLKNASEVASAYFTGLNYIEDMLRKQLTAAVGKELQAVDFVKYMDYHNRKIFAPQYAPEPFCFAIRRPHHYPDGTVSIEATLRGESVPQPIRTMQRQLPSAPMFFSVNAATKVTFNGERYLHAWVNHQFQGDNGVSLSLSCRARQFSSFLVLIGNLASGEEFAPKYSIILQNKDSLTVPLMLDQLPTPQEFRDAIESMSPEQQRFAKAYRSMQLEGSTFGVLVIQLKPQLERLLNLQDDSLTKQIKLTQDLLKLFIEYQIPSDLLSYDGNPAAEPGAKVEEVKKHVAAIFAMIDEAKSVEVAEALQKQQFNQPERGAVNRGGGFGFGGGGGAAAGAVFSMGASKSRGVRRAEMMMVEQSVMASDMLTSCAPMMASEAARPPPMAMKAKSRSMAESAPAAPAAVAKQPNVQQPTPDEGAEPEAEEGGAAFDFTKVPQRLDAAFSALDEDNALRPTTLKAGEVWQKKEQKKLLGDPETRTLRGNALTAEKTKAYDLLDALSRSGVLPIESASLHVVVAATHCFDKSLVNTVIQDNVNPIEKIERSNLIVATTVHEKAAEEMLQRSQVGRIAEFSAPALLTITD